MYRGVMQLISIAVWLILVIIGFSFLITILFWKKYYSDMNYFDFIDHVHSLSPDEWIEEVLERTEKK